MTVLNQHPPLLTIQAPVRLVRLFRTKRSGTSGVGKDLPHIYYTQPLPTILAFHSFTSAIVLCRVADPHHIDADPDPAFHFDGDQEPTFHSDAEPYPNPAFQFDADPDPITHFCPDLDPPILQNSPLRLPPFHFDADPDPSFHFDADPALAFHFDADPDTASPEAFG
jgi:hypothetical protein